MSAERPYFHYSISELEQLYADNKDNKQILEQMLNELKYRTRPRAKKLLIEITNILSDNTQRQSPVEPVRTSYKICLEKKATSSGMTPPLSVIQRLIQTFKPGTKM